MRMDRLIETFLLSSLHSLQGSQKETQQIMVKLTTCSITPLAAAQGTHGQHPWSSSRSPRRRPSWASGASHAARTCPACKSCWYTGWHLQNIHACIYVLHVLMAGAKVRVQELVVGVTDSRPSGTSVQVGWLCSPGKALLILRVALSFLGPACVLLWRLLPFLRGARRATLGMRGFLGRGLPIPGFYFRFGFRFRFRFRAGLFFGRSLQILGRGLVLGRWGHRLWQNLLATTASPATASSTTSTARFLWDVVVVLRLILHRLGLLDT